MYKAVYILQAVGSGEFCFRLQEFRDNNFDIQMGRHLDVKQGLKPRLNVVTYKSSTSCKQQEPSRRLKIELKKLLLLSKQTVLGFY